MSATISRHAAASAAILAAVSFTAAAFGAINPWQRPNNPVQKAGKYAVELRIPAGGLFAGEETDVEFRVTDFSQDDPVQGAPPIVNAKISATVTMPAMPSMPAQEPRIHAEGVPGDYGVVLYFPHGGDYRVALTIAPPGDKPFTVAFKIPVGDAQPAGKRKPTPPPFTLEVVSNPRQPRAGEPAELTIQVRRRETGKPVTDFEVEHERLIHFMVVSRDLSQFSHEHPELGKDGKFTLTYTFPTGGEYRLFADLAPKGAGSVVLMQPIKIAGPPPNGPDVLKSNASPVAVVDGMRIAPKGDAHTFVSGRTLPMTFVVSEEKSGAPVTDIQPWLGAVAHLILLQEDGATFVHSHPDETEPSNGKSGRITFLARFPKPGVYRGWLQFQRAGKVETAAFTVEAQEVKSLP